MPEVDFSQLTAAGIRSATNADAVGEWPFENGRLFALADGAGEHGVGAVASALALELFAHEMACAPATWELQKRLRRAVQAANLGLYEKAIAVPELRHMSSTLLVTAVVGSTLVAAHVGNGRLLLSRRGKLAQLTKDHAWVWEQVEAGTLDADAAYDHPRRHVLTRSLGRELIVAVDVLTLALRAGDVLLQCSDGLHAVLGEREMAELVAAHPPEPACRALVRRAREEGGDDDVSVQVAAVVSCPATNAWWRLGR